MKMEERCTRADVPPHELQKASVVAASSRIEGHRDFGYDGIVCSETNTCSTTNFSRAVPWDTSYDAEDCSWRSSAAASTFFGIWLRQPTERSAQAYVCSPDHSLSPRGSLTTEMTDSEVTDRRVSVALLGRGGSENSDASALTDAARVAMVWLRASGTSDPLGRFHRACRPGLQRERRVFESHRDECPMQTGKNKRTKVETSACRNTSATASHLTVFLESADQRK